MNLSKIQFRVLYRQFLFRIVDLELLSAQADTSKLLGQFASILVFFSLILSLIALFSDNRGLPAAARLASSWYMEHFLIATTMLVVGLFAVLSWDSLFPNQQDVMVLAPLPVRPQMLFLAKLAAVGTALGIAVLALNGLSGLAWPLALSLGNGFAPTLRLLAAYWITTLAAGVFIFSSVLSVQGLAAQILPRRMFLRVSALLQVAAFCLFLSVYFLEPPLATPTALSAPQNQSLLAVLPSYWFLALLQMLNGSLPSALEPLAQHALIGLAISVSLAGAACLLSYFRTMKKIAEQPDIVPGSRRITWTPAWGNSLPGAIALFSIRTLFRSRQHRAILCFYLGVGLFMVVLYAKSDLVERARLDPWQQLSLPVLVSSIVMMCLALVGTRMAFSMPLQLGANWIFRTTPVGRLSKCLRGARRALILLALVPVWMATAIALLAIAPWRHAVGHLAILGLLGLILTDVCLYSFPKIPFTCSYLPGKSNVYFRFWAYFFLAPVVNWAARFERRALQHIGSAALTVAIFAALAIFVQWLTARRMRSSDAALEFEQDPAPLILSLGLHRDGVLPVGKAP
jgi:hypothetical protein